MPRYAHLVMGPAGSGKSTYCHAMLQHLQALRRSAHVVNLDPAAEEFNYDVSWDIRDVISLDDVAETLSFGPNGGLIYCMEFLLQNVEVLEDAFAFDDDYILIDCPGQIELYTHLPIMRQFVQYLQSLDFRIVDDTSKFFSGMLSAISAMLQLEIPHLNLLSKLDLISPAQREDLEKFVQPCRFLAYIHSYLSPDPDFLLMALNPITSERQHRLNEAMATLLNDFSLVKFIGFDCSDEDSLTDVLIQADHCLQYGEDEEPRDPDEYDADAPDHGDES